MMSDKIFILDEVVVGPGMSAAYRDAYLKHYAPGARERGMALESVWRTPPFDLAEKGATLYFLWSVDGILGWWTMRLGAARVSGEEVSIDEGDEKSGWWLESVRLSISRRRLFLTDYDREQR